VIYVVAASVIGMFFFAGYSLGDFMGYRRGYRQGKEMMRTVHKAKERK
jgi:hypothetical protein